MKQTRTTRRKNKIALTALIIITAASIKVVADDQDQYWLTGTAKWKATDQVALKVSGQTRYKNTGHYYNRVDLGIAYTFNKNWSIATAYRYVNLKTKKYGWADIDGWLLDFGNLSSGLGMDLKTRIRFAYFNPRYYVDSITDFRPKFTLSPSKGFTDWQLKPYLADEIMYNLNEDWLYRNRLSAGLKCKPSKYLALDLFVMNERTDRDYGWVENWNAGLGVTASF